MTTSTITLPSFGNYGNYSSGNYGVNCLYFVDSEGRTIYFSYETLVAVDAGGERAVIRNYWGPTTGKHLNWIDGGDKSSRLSRGDFDRRVAELLS